jgi:hypothetical protein
MRFQSKKLVAAASLASTVAAHGYVDTLSIAGVEYTVCSPPVSPIFQPVSSRLTAAQGYQPYTDPYYNPPPQRIVRAVPGNGPVQDLTLIDLQCNGYTDGGVIGSQPAPLVGGPVAAGSTISLNWTLWPDSHGESHPGRARQCAREPCDGGGVAAC